MKIKLIFLIGFCISNTMYSQTLDSVIKQINQYCQIEYKVKKWSVNESKIDTSFSKSSHCVYLTSSDSLIGGFFKFDYDKKAEIYNGVEYIMIDKIKRIATVVNLKDALEWKINNVYCSDSYLEIIRILKRAKNDKAFKWTEGNNEIKINAVNIAYFGRIEDDKGTNTEFVIKLTPKSYNLQYMTIKSFKDGELTLNQGVNFSELKIFDSPEIKYYSKNRIDPSFTTVEHKYFKNINVGDTMPNWIIYAPYNNNKILLRELNKENILLIEFWFTHCQYCIKSIPALTELQNRYKDSGFKIIYANNSNGSESDKEISDFKNKYSITFDVFRFGNIFEQGFSPTLMLVDKNGIIRYKKDGYEENLIDEVEKIIKLNK